MTAINTILDTNWDAGICTKPTFFTKTLRGEASVGRGVTTLIANTSDEIIGIMSREYYSPDSHDGYLCTIITTTETDTRDMIQAIKKICATYSPTSAENVLTWEGGTWRPFNGVRFIFDFVLMVYRAGIDAY